MRFDHTTNANAAFEATADHCDQLAAFYAAESEKMKGVAKTMRQLASAEGVPSDPQIVIKPPGIGMRLTGIASSSRAQAEAARNMMADEPKAANG